MPPIYTTETPVAVENSNGSSKRSQRCQNCGTWLDHLVRLSGKTPGNCSIEGCDKPATDGAHVLRPLARKDEYRNHSYILPMCHSHNMSTDQLIVKPGSTFVWANVSETCGKISKAKTHRPLD